MTDTVFKWFDRLARFSGMDCWFCIDEDEDGGVIVRDFEEGSPEGDYVIDTTEGLLMFAQGLCEPLEDYGMNEYEIAELLEVFEDYGIYYDEDKGFISARA